MKATRAGWAGWQDKVLITTYPDYSNKHIAMLVERTVSSVKNRATYLKLKKSAAYMEQSRKETQFKKGLHPWNKGKAFPSHPNTKKTQFKAGEKSSSWRPIGTRRITKEGYEEVKVTDTGITRNDYQAVHRLVWQQHHGEIPEGHMVAFKSPNKTDVSIENLELISRAENMRRNSIVRYPAEIRGAIHTLAKLKRNITKVAK